MSAGWLCGINIAARGRTGGPSLTGDAAAAHGRLSSLPAIRHARVYVDPATAARAAGAAASNAVQAARRAAGVQNTATRPTVTRKGRSA